MPVIHKDPLVDRWVIVSPERLRRPSDFDDAAQKQPSRICPFCPGHEAMTPGEVLAYRPSHSSPNSPGWTVRVVPNKYPALRLSGALTTSSTGAFTALSGVGAHEVIIETAVHQASLASLPLPQVERVLSAFQTRLQQLRQDDRLCSALIFKNHGAAAGATLMHPHSQLIVLPMVPTALQGEMDNAARHFQAHGRCIVCDLVVHERQIGGRVIVDRTGYVALAPFASRCAFEVCIIPKRHAAWFEHDDGAGYSGLAEVLREVLQRLNVLLDHPDYNIVWHSAPWIEACEPYYHWHVEILPRLTGIAGFEWGTGWYINSTSPEEAAGALRRVSIGAGD